MTGVQEPVVEIVDGLGTRCAGLTPLDSPSAGVEASPEIIPLVTATEGEVASPAASPITVVLESCAPLDRIPAT